MEIHRLGNRAGGWGRRVCGGGGFKGKCNYRQRVRTTERNPAWVSDPWLQRYRANSSLHDGGDEVIEELPAGGVYEVGGNVLEEDGAGLGTQMVDEAARGTAQACA
jgi:hypothetical protein